MLKKPLLYFAFVLLLAHNLQAQVSTSIKSTISGIVLDSITHLPLVGTTIKSKVDKVNAITDSSGKFILHLTLPNSIIVHRIGYEESQFDIKQNDRGIVIQLLPVDHDLDEVLVSTGYQTLPKERATGSFEVIDRSILQQQISTDIISKLKGRSSILFDAGTNRPSLTIRGLSSIHGDKDPLIVLNNFPYEGDINNINPNDVESVTILKDAAATSIWGTKASNGVIVITTKHAAYGQPLKISLIANFKLIDKPDLNYTRQISSSDFINVEKFLFNNGYKFSDTSSLSRPAFTPAYEILFKERDGLISNVEAQSLLDQLGEHSVFDDFNKYIYQRGVLHQYVINMDGGSSRDAYHISTSFDNEITNENSRGSRFTFHIENSFLPIKELRILTSIFYNQSNSRSGRPTYDGLKMKLYPYARLASAGGVALPLYKNYRKSFIDTIGEGKLLDWRYFPLEDYRHTISRSNNQDLLGNLTVEYNPFSGFKFILQYQYERQEKTADNLNDLGSFYARDLINKFTQIDPNTGVIKYVVPLGSVLNKSNSVLESQSFRAQVDYEHSFKYNNIALLFGTEIRNVNQISNSYRRYGYDDNVLTFSNVDLVNAYPTIVPGSKQFIPDFGGIEESTNRFVSVFGNIAYTLNDRYIISSSARRDASNLFGVKTNEKWSPLWSIGGSWIISHEPFWKSNTFDYLKLRTTYGYSGNVDQNRSAVTTIRYFGSARYTNYQMATVDQFPNPDLRWEKTGMLNLGVDFSFIDHKLKGSIEYYNKKSIDLFGYAPTDWTATGANSLLINIANMRGHGWNFDFFSRILDNRLKWDISLNANISKSKVSKYYTSNEISSAFVNNGTSINPLVGFPVYGLVSYKWGGLDANNGDPLGYLNGTKSKDYRNIFSQDLSHLIFNGPATPTFYGSIFNTFSYLNFSFHFNFLFKFGYYYRKPSINYTALISNFYGDIDYSSRWQTKGDEQFTNVPSMVYPNVSNRDIFYSHSSVLVEKADNIRLQFVSLDYQFSEKVLTHLPFQSMSFSIIANNIGVIWRAGDKGIDPDYPNSMNPIKNYSVGIKVFF